MFLWNFCHHFQYGFMNETQVLMAISDFFDLFSRNHFLEGGFIFRLGGFVFQLWGFIFKWEEVPHRFWWNVFKKVMGWGGGGEHTPNPPTRENLENACRCRQNPLRCLRWRALQHSSWLLAVMGLWHQPSYMTIIINVSTDLFQDKHEYSLLKTCKCEICSQVKMII